jgi:hypothetical protein
MHDPALSFGRAIASVALDSRLTPVDTAVALATVLSNLAGPRACIRGVAGEPISPRINAIVAGLDNPSWVRIQELIIGPIEAKQRTCREFSQSLSPERLVALHTSRNGHDTDRRLDINFDYGCPQPSAAQRKSAEYIGPLFCGTGGIPRRWVKPWTKRR